MNLVVMEFQIQICPILCLLVDFGEVLCSSASKLQQNSNVSSREDRLYSRNIDCFVRDSLLLNLTFVAFCILSVIRKQ